MKIKCLIKNMISVLPAFVLAVMLIPCMRTEAASEYTVTFRPGNVGSFDLEQAQGFYRAYGTVTTTEHAIKVTVPYGSAMPPAYSYVNPEEGYFVKSWGPGEDEQDVEKNVDYVVDYGRLVDGVEYTIRYVEESTKESIAPPVTAYGNIGDRVASNAPLSLTTTEYVSFKLQNSSSQSIVLQADSKLNVITFEYKRDSESGTVVKEIVNYEDGGTDTVTDTVHTVLNQGGNAEPGAVQINQNAGEGEQNNPADNEENDIVNIEEEDTPLADGIDGEDEQEVVVIDDETVPLDASLNQNFNPIVGCAVIAGVAAVLVLVFWFLAKRKRKNRENSEDSESL